MTQKEMEKRITELEAQMKALTSSTSIPRNVETALRYRLGVLTSNVATGSYASIRRTINLSGDPESISVLEDPAGYILITYKNATYKVPYFQD